MTQHTLYNPPAGLPPPSPDAIAHASLLLELMQNFLEKQHGKMSFEQFMSLALYAPGLGYYSAGAKKIGFDGDFITAPEISSLFSYCLARQCNNILDSLEGGDILEFGAGSGKMAVDILSYLAKQKALPAHYFIVETSADLIQRQKQNFQDNAPHLLSYVRWLSALPLHFKGVMIANEVLDAMPVHRFSIEGDTLQEYYVGWQNDAFIWLKDKPCDRVREAIIQIQQEGLLRENHYTSEINLRAAAWIKTVSDSLEKGAVLLIDYGFPRNIYYHSQRSEGTLMCHYQHRAHPNPLILVGLQDITAHVDFSFVAQCAINAGFLMSGYTTQSKFLLNCGLLNLVNAEADLSERLATSRQIQTLTMPHEMGESFN
jgi:SAM-dependent MidA family methyltransferase